MQLTTLPSRFPELQAELDAYLAYYNRRRPHMALGGLAPLEFLAKMHEESAPSLTCVDRLQSLEFLVDIRHTRAVVP